MGITTKTIDVKTQSSKAYPASKGENLELMYKIAIIGIVLAILILVFDVWRDNSLHSRITELERQVADDAKEFTTEKYNLSNEINTARNEFKDNKENVSMENEQNKKFESLNSIVDCLKNKKYWQYEQCFK